MAARIQERDAAAERVAAAVEQERARWVLQRCQLRTSCRYPLLCSRAQRL